MEIAVTETDKSPSFEESLTELEAIVTQMENGDLPLNEALEKFELGIKLSRASQQALEQAEQKVKILLSEQGQDTLSELSDENE